MSTAPRYWMHEESGVLRPVMQKYLDGNDLDSADVAVMRSYLTQWIMGPFVGVGDLRTRVASLNNTTDVRRWIDDAVSVGIDPL